MGAIQSKFYNLSTNHSRYPRSLENVRRYYNDRKFAMERVAEKERTPLLILRLITLVLLVMLLTMHIKSLRVFRWEQSVSGGVLVTYVVAVVGLALCAGLEQCGGRALQAYLCSTGGALLVANCAAILRRWRYANELTRAVAELLFALGVPLKRQVMFKVCLSGAAAFCLLLDLAMVPIFAFISQEQDIAQT